MFVFEGDYVSDIFPDEDNAYEFVTFNYIERSVLNKVPRYSFIANTITNEYYFKAALPESDDGTYICPLPFILSEKSCSDLMGIKKSILKINFPNMSFTKFFVVKRKRKSCI